MPPLGLHLQLGQPERFRQIGIIVPALGGRRCSHTIRYPIAWSDPICLACTSILRLCENMIHPSPQLVTILSPSPLVPITSTAPVRFCPDPFQPHFDLGAELDRALVSQPSGSGQNMRSCKHTPSSMDRERSRYRFRPASANFLATLNLLWHRDRRPYGRSSLAAISSRVLQ